jgi:transcription elongation factor GreA
MSYSDTHQTFLILEGIPSIYTPTLCQILDIFPSSTTLYLTHIISQLNLESSKMNKKNLKLTREGKEFLENKLENLNKELIEMKEEIRMTIKILGTRDSQYHLLQGKKEEILSEIKKTEHILNTSEVFEQSDAGTTVELGNRVKLQNHKYSYDVRIVSTIEANPTQRLVSDESPIGQSVLGRKLGETIMIATPAGEVDFLIKEIS